MSTASTPRVFLGQPRPEVVEAFRREQALEVFSYEEVGATRDGVLTPVGFDLDHNRVRLGEGESAWERACMALRAWRMFPQPWTSITPADAPLREGQVVAMQARALGLTWLNACRIAYVIDETVAGVRRFGFAYGTLPGHVEQGEERFTVERHANGDVWYDIRAFSRPRYWPVRLGKPLARRLQARFVRDSKRAMEEAVR